MAALLGGGTGVVEAVEWWSESDRGKMERRSNLAKPGSKTVTIAQFIAEQMLTDLNAYYDHPTLLQTQRG